MVGNRSAAACPISSSHREARRRRTAASLAVELRPRGLTAADRCKATHAETVSLCSGRQIAAMVKLPLDQSSRTGSGGRAGSAECSLAQPPPTRSSLMQSSLTSSPPTRPPPPDAAIADVATVIIDGRISVRPSRTRPPASLNASNTECVHHGAVCRHPATDVVHHGHGRITLARSHPPG